MAEISLDAKKIQINCFLANKQIELDRLSLKLKNVTSSINAIEKEITAAMDELAVIDQEIEDSETTSALIVGPSVDWERGWL